MTELILEVRCPCGATRGTTSIIECECFKCGQTFQIFPKNEKSRVVEIKKGSIEILHEKLRRLKNERKARYNLRASGNGMGEGH
jgi:hypothetical protein